MLSRIQNTIRNTIKQQQSINFNDIYSEIVQNKQNHDNGYYNCIPFIGLNRLEKYLPGIEQGTYYLITASTGVKSKINLHINL